MGIEGYSVGIGGIRSIMAQRRMNKDREDDKRKKSRKDKDEEMLPKKRSRFLEGVTDIDINDYQLLRKFVTEHGKIIASSLTGATAKQQRQIKRGVRRARVIGMLP